MKVRIIQQMSGSRPNGLPWPPAGTVLDVPDWEGRSLCATGDSHDTPIAVPVVEERAETRPAPQPTPVETRAPEPAAAVAAEPVAEAKPTVTEQPEPPEQPVKRGPGRPPGSTNKPRPQ